MNAAAWRRVEELFASALERPTEERTEYVRAVADPDTAREVLSLLEAYERRGALDSLTDKLRTLMWADASVNTSDLAARLGAGLAGQYRIEREIGRGGMAFVFAVEDLKHHRKVALKVLQPGLASSLGSARFLREIATAAQLAHPNILPLHDSGEVDGLLYYVMPYVDGESLRDRLRREGRLPLNSALAIACEVADAISYAHSHDVVHRDIKPENILIQAGHAVVSDFGIARAMSAAGAGQLSDTGVILGTPAYMSPEQITGRQVVDGRADVYSLGCVLYEMLAGHAPFAADSMEQTLSRKVREAAPPLRAIRRSTPASVERVLSRALAANPDQRYPSISQFAADLSRLQVPTAVGRRRGLAVVAAIALTVAGLAGYFVLPRRTATDLAPIRSLAVLPLRNLMHDSTQDYFVAGMHEALIGELGRISALTVISRASSMRYRTGQKPMREIARELNVEALVAGTVLKRRQKIRIEVRMMRPLQSDDVLWDGTFEGELRNVLSLQNEIAAAIAEQIRVTLTPQERTHFVQLHVVDPVAYDAWVRAWYELTRWTERSLRSCIADAGQALQADSNYAPAYALKALCWNILPHVAPVDPRDAFPSSKAAATRALELDEGLADAHFALAWALAAYDWDWVGAEREYRRGLELNPNSAYGHGRYQVLLTSLGRYDEAVAESRRAIALSPLGPNEISANATALYAARRYDEAIAAALRAVAVDSSFAFGHDRLGWAYTEKGMYPEAIAALNRAVALSGGALPFKAELARAYALSGQRAEAYRILGELLRLDRAGYGGPAWIGLVYLALGDKDEALNWLERAYQKHDPNLMWLRGLPMWDPLRSEPRFRILLQRLNFPD